MAISNAMGSNKICQGLVRVTLNISFAVLWLASAGLLTFSNPGTFAFLILLALFVSTTGANVSGIVSMSPSVPAAIQSRT